MSLFVYTDVLIIGAGPAGATTSLFLSKQKIKHVIIDKATFPRDKICGDAISGKTVDVLKKFDPLTTIELTTNNKFLDSWGVSFYAPNGKCLDVPFKNNVTEQTPPPGYIVKRLDFDDYLVKKIDPQYAELHQQLSADKINFTNDGVEVECVDKDHKRIIIKSKLLVDAAGDRALLGPKKEAKHYCAGLRSYYKGVEGMHPKNFIELHFIQDILPGYLWIFPLPDGYANVGIGMLSSEVSKKKVNLKKVFNQVLAEHPVISKRFKNAQLIDDVKGWGLPLGSKKRKLSGERYLLVGDAASLIDPFTGEGIGNGMKSGMIAAKHIERALSSQNFSANVLNAYDEDVYAKLGGELRLSHTIQRLTKYKGLFNLVVNKANKNKHLQEAISCMFDDLDMRKKLQDPVFYFKILFG